MKRNDSQQYAEPEKKGQNDLKALLAVARGMKKDGFSFPEISDILGLSLNELKIHFS